MLNNIKLQIAMLLKELGKERVKQGRLGELKATTFTIATQIDAKLGLGKIMQEQVADFYREDKKYPRQQIRRCLEYLNDVVNDLIAERS